MKSLSIPLQLTARVLSPVMLALSLVVLYRGHHLPGGGFIGGLLAAAAITLVMLGTGVAAARAALRVPPLGLVVAGLFCAVASGLVGPLTGSPAILQGVWLPPVAVPVLGVVHAGTPLLFDAGVYLTVVGFTLTCLFALMETDNEPSGRGPRA
jgi:multicomponent Na+:H+ antiporter subunit B